jgi:hypothetical protein
VGSQRPFKQLLLGMVTHETFGYRRDEEAP